MADHNTITQAGNKEAIELWRAVTIESVRNDDYNLSARQLAILLTVYTKQGPHTVKNLAATLNINKPPICRALDTLSKHKLTIRRTDPNDRRIVYIQTTEEGFDYLGTFSEHIMDKLVML